MKLLTTQQIKDWDTYTIYHEPVASINLMERAALACTDKIKILLKKKSNRPVYIFCGKGNNGGDGLAIARLLAQEGYTLTVYILNITSNESPDFAVNQKRLQEQNKTVIQFIQTENDFPEIPENTLVIDALFGTGLNRPLDGLAAQLVQYINQQQTEVISIDMPSGLPGELFTVDDLKGAAVIKARQTLTFQVPKLSFLHAETFDFVGTFTLLDIGLHAGFEQITENKFHYITANDIQQRIQPRTKFSHKGTFGHVLTVGGSYGKIGASLLMSKAALRTGCGLVTAFVPKVGYTILQTAFPECMVQTDDELYEIRNFPQTNTFDALGIGPGLGQNEYTIKNFARWINTIDKPCVLDADALNICARLLLEHHDTFRFPKQCIITPHPKEFDRLSGISKNSVERLEKQIHFAQKYKVIVVLKGAHTSCATPTGEVYFNSTGNVAMATAGSGDILTGILTSLLAQGYSDTDAAILGVYLHGLAGDLAIQNKSTLIASDIIEMLPCAFSQIQ